MSATVTNTGTSPIDYITVQSSLEAIGQAATQFDLVTALELFAKGTGMSGYALLYTSGGRVQLSVVHNLPGTVDPGWLATHPLTVRAQQTPIPGEFATELGLDGLQRGIVAGGGYGHATCVLYVGHSTSSALPDPMGLAGLTSMAAMQLSDTCRRLEAAACPLTPRELQILTMTAAGASAKEAARWLNISHRTVEEYILRCKKRLEVETSLAATALALRRGWMTHDDVDRFSEELSSRYGEARKRSQGFR